MAGRDALRGMALIGSTGQGYEAAAMFLVPLKCR
jgi:hypothetical protein